MLGNRTLVRDLFDVCAKTVLVGNETEPTQLWKNFCGQGNMSSSQCDDYFSLNNVTEIQGIPGMASGIIRGGLANIHTLYCKENRHLYVGFPRLSAKPWCVCR